MVPSRYPTTAGVVLLLPVSHSDYTLFFLPILWIWAARWLETPRLGGLVFLVAGLLMFWWLVSTKDWYYGLRTESALRLSVVFFASQPCGSHIVCLRRPSSEDPFTGHLQAHCPP